jgi:uncharacterized protein
MTLSRLQLAALLPNENVELNLAYLYQMGIDGEKDINKAISMYENLANSGNDLGMYYLGSIYLNLNKLDKALSYYEKAAELNNASACYWVSAIYAGYQNHTKNDSKASYYLDRAAELGHFFAKRDLALMKLNKANYLIPKIKAYLQYIIIKFRALFLILINHNDFRVR